MEEPLVTVAMPLYNSERFVRQAIKGVLAQNFKDFELLCVDDASQDATLDIVREYKDPRVRLVCNESNLGLYGNFNRCLDLARGKYLFFNHDDVMLPDTLQRAVAICESDERIDACGLNAWIVDESLTVERPYFNYTNEDVVFDTSSFLASYAQRYSMAISSTLLRMRTLREHHLKFDAEDGLSADTVFWVRLALVCQRLYFVHEPLFLRRVHGSNASSGLRGRAGTKEWISRTSFSLYCVFSTSSLDEAEKNIYCQFVQRCMLDEMSQVLDGTDQGIADFVDIRDTLQQQAEEAVRDGRCDASFLDFTGQLMTIKV